MRRLCEVQPDVVIDIGANYGEFSIIPAQLGLRCLVVEPNPFVVQRLRQTMEPYQNVNVIPCAVGERPGKRLFHFCRFASGSGSFAASTPTSEANELSFGEGATEIEVEVNTIDELVRAFADFMDCSSVVLKIDVEGFEQEVLKGASILDDLTWWRALVEFSPIGLQNAGKSVEDSWQFFRAYKGVVVHGGFDPRQGGLGVLPIKPPRHDVDILIGEGSIPNRDGLLAAL